MSSMDANLDESRLGDRRKTRRPGSDRRQPGEAIDPVFAAVYCADLEALEAALQSDDQRQVLPDLAGRARHADRLPQMRLRLAEIVGHGIGEPDIGLDRRFARRRHLGLRIDLARLGIASASVSHPVEAAALAARIA